MNKENIDLYIGIDVQIKRGCPYYILNADLGYVESGWLKGDCHDEVCQQLDKRISWLLNKSNKNIAVGIDAPRMGLASPRTWYWRGGKWRKRTGVEKGFGRHCEVVIKALGIANPQWTQMKDSSPPWMELGYRLYQTLQGLEHVHEVFPSASYAMLGGQEHDPIGLSFADFVHGPKDMLDACVGAYTVHAFHTGGGFEVGGGDGLGTIILPGSLPVIKSHPVIHWPD